MSLHFMPTVWLSNFLYSSLFLPSLHLPTSYYYVLLLLLFSFLFFFFFPHWYLLTSSLFSSSSTEGKIKVDGQHAYRLLQVSLISSGPFTPKTLSNKHSKLRLWKTSKNGIQMLTAHHWARNSTRKGSLWLQPTEAGGTQQSAMIFAFFFFFLHLIKVNSLDCMALQHTLYRRALLWLLSPLLSSRSDHNCPKF